MSSPAEPRPALRKRAPSHPLEPPAPPPEAATVPEPPQTPPAAPPAPEEPLVPFGTRVPQSLRKQLRILAVTTGTTEQALTIEALRWVLNRHQAAAHQPPEAPPTTPDPRAAG
jgi:hypothetical protein